MELQKEEYYWRHRVEILWVKGHADKLKRKSTETEKLNQEVDKLADAAYKVEVPLEAETLQEINSSPQMCMEAEDKKKYILTGVAGAQIREQIKLENGIKCAQEKPQIWGMNAQEIAWKAMMKSISSGASSSIICDPVLCDCMVIAHVHNT